MIRRAFSNVWNVRCRALFFETPKGPFDHPVLFRGIGRNEILLQ